MAAKKQAPVAEPEVVSSPEPEPVAEPERAEVPGWPGVKIETPEEHDARRQAEANARA